MHCSGQSTEHVRREVAARQPGGDDVGAVPAGKHHQPGAHLRHALPQVLMRVEQEQKVWASIIHAVVFVCYVLNLLLLPVVHRSQLICTNLVILFIFNAN